MSDSIDKLAEALAAAQGAFTNPPKDGKNPHFNSRYATLDALQNATRKALAENGLSITQGGDCGPSGTWVLMTTLRHSCGGSITNTFPLLSFAKGPQAAGSEITYMRRYAYAAMLNITADEDDDANSAQSAPSSQPTREYKLNPSTSQWVDPVSQGAPPSPTTQAPREPVGELGKAIGAVGKINAAADGKCWFLSIGALGTAKGESVWCRDKELVESLNVGDEIQASLRSKKPGSYQLVSFIADSPPEE